MMIVALYSRVSTQEQAQNGYSIDEQKDRMEKYCAAMNWNTYQFYTDAGYTGANTDRPALKKLIRDVKSGNIDKVLVYKLDRLSRSQKDTLYLIEDIFIANGADFISMSENFDTSTAFGRAMIGILAVFAQLEREQIKERMKMGLSARAKQGKFHGSSRVPIGYDYINGEIVTNDFEKIQIIKIFEMYAQGISPNKIAQTLNESGYSHKYGSWIESTVRHILPQKTYLGYTKHHGEWYKGSHEAFIDETLFETVQQIREQKATEHKKHNRRAGKANSYLGGYLVCKRCGAKYVKIQQQGSRRKDGIRPTYNYYECNSRSKKRKSGIKDPNCMNKNWRLDELDNIVLDQIKRLALDPDYISEIAASQKSDNTDQIIQEQIDNLNNQLSRLIDLYSLDQIPVDTLQSRVKSINDQIAKLETEQKNVLSERQKKLSAERTSEIVRSFSDILDRGDFDEIRTVIGALIEYIELDGENIYIHWNFA